MKTLALLSAVACLAAPALAQDEDLVILDDLGIKFTKPADYRRARPEELRPTMRFLLRSPTSDRYKATVHADGQVVNLNIVGGIFLMVLPKPKDGLHKENEGIDLPTPEDVSRLVPGLVYQNAAKIKISGHDAVAVLGTIGLQEKLGLPEDGMIRLIFMEHKNSLLLWGFGAIDSEFKPRVKAFEKMMATVRFKGDPEPKPTGKKK